MEKKQPGLVLAVGSLITVAMIFFALPGAERLLRYAAEVLLDLYPRLRWRPWEVFAIGVTTGVAVWAILFEACYRIAHWIAKRRQTKRKEKLPEFVINASGEGVRWRWCGKTVIYRRSLDGSEVVFVSSEPGHFFFFPGQPEDVHHPYLFVETAGDGLLQHSCGWYCPAAIPGSVQEIMNEGKALLRQRTLTP